MHQHGVRNHHGLGHLELRTRLPETVQTTTTTTTTTTTRQNKQQNCNICFILPIDELVLNSVFLQIVFK